jgi:calpain, invertebrate
VLPVEVRDGAPHLLDGQNYDRNSLQQVAKPPNFITLREVTAHLQVPPGHYIIMPCTFYPDQEGQFLLRVYTETAISAQ